MDPILAAHKAIQAAERIAMPWYHVSPHDLPEGTVLTPGGRPSNFFENEDIPDALERRKHVWVTDTPEHARDWAGVMYEQTGHWPGHLYEVQPGAEPAIYNPEYPDDEWKVPSATITKKLTPKWLKHPHFFTEDN